MSVISSVLDIWDLTAGSYNLKKGMEGKEVDASLPHAHSSFSEH